MDSLPLVLLGIRTAVKEDIQCTAAEMVYGTTLRLPGELITPSHPESVNTSDFVAQLKTRMQQALAKPPRPVNRNSHVSDDLNTCTHVQYKPKKSSRSVYVQRELNVDAFKKQRNKNAECTERFRLNQQFFYTFFLKKLQNVFTVKKHVPAFIVL